uniref:Uncharacterized protein n=1 Tax=Oryza punctata TaxID=4537 RepID=A0A0E0L9Y2_ORYPU
MGRSRGEWDEILCWWPRVRVLSKDVVGSSLKTSPKSSSSFHVRRRRPDWETRHKSQGLRRKTSSPRRSSPNP